MPKRKRHKILIEKAKWCYIKVKLKSSLFHAMKMHRSLGIKRRSVVSLRLRTLTLTWLKSGHFPEQFCTKYHVSKEEGSKGCVSICGLRYMSFSTIHQHFRSPTREKRRVGNQDWKMKNTTTQYTQHINNYTIKMLGCLGARRYRPSHGTDKRQTR